MIRPAAALLTLMGCSLAPPPGSPGNTSGTGADTASPAGPTAAAGPDLVVAVGTPGTLFGEAAGGVGVWDFGDGHTQAGAEVRHTWDTPGTYTAVFQVTAADAQTATDSARVTVHRPISPEHRSHSSPIAVHPSKGHVWVVNPEAATVAELGPSGALLAEHNVCSMPRSLAISADGFEVGVACEGAGVLAVINASDGGVDFVTLPGRGTRPYGVAAGEQGWWLSLQGPGSLLHVLDGSFTETTLGPDPRGVAVLGEQVAVSRFRSTDLRGLVYRLDGDDWALPLDDRPDSDTVSGGVPGLIDQIAFTPDGGSLLVPAVQSNALRGPFFGTEALSFETTVRAVLSTVELDAGESLSTRKIFDERGRAIAAIPSPLGDRVYVAHPGTRSVTVLDGYSGDIRGSWLDLGHAPSGLALSPDGSVLYVQLWLDREVVALDTTDLANTTPIWRAQSQTWEALDETVLQGKRLFYDSLDTRLAKGGYHACAHCHPDGRDDGLTWDFTDRGEGLRNTTSLEGRAGTGMGRVHWTGNFDEIQDFEHDIRNAFGGTGLLSEEDWDQTNDTLGAPKAGRSADLDALAAFVTSLETTPESPHEGPGGDDQPFVDAGCADCHLPPLFTDSSLEAPRRHDVGTWTEASGQRLGGELDGFDTPTLLGVWATAPYLHDGSAPTVEAAITAHDSAQALSAEDIAWLADYVRNL